MMMMNSISTKLNELNIKKILCTYTNAKLNNATKSITNCKACGLDKSQLKFGN